MTDWVAVFEMADQLAPVGSFDEPDVAAVVHVTCSRQIRDAMAEALI